MSSSSVLRSVLAGPSRVEREEAIHSLRELALREHVRVHPDMQVDPAACDLARLRTFIRKLRGAGRLNRAG
jgi:hypothetical protein